MPLAFTDTDAMDWLAQASAADKDSLPFGVITMAPDALVVHYNQAEAAFSGLTPSRVVGRHFFHSVAGCTNNYLIAERYLTEPELDALLDYVFTFHMAPTPVRLRLLKRSGAKHMYLLVERRQTHDQ